MGNEQNHLDAIPPQPTAIWRVIQTLRGTNSTYLTEKEVPATDLRGKWIVISGANNGIGYEAAKTFAKWGANLVLACREPPRWENPPSMVVEECRDIAQSSGHASDISWWELDMASLESVQKFAQRWLDTGRPLDILCNNAGIASPPATEQVSYTDDGFEFIHQVNLLSHVLLTLSVFPSLVQSAEPRIVCTTSCYHFLSRFDPVHFNGGAGTTGGNYGNNKLYFQMWVAELQSRLLKREKYRHVTINGINPGYVNTGIWTSNQPQLRGGPIERLGQFLVRKLGITPQQGSLAIVHAATSIEFGPDPETQGVGLSQSKGGGKYINRIWEATSMPHCYSTVARSEVWKKLDEELKLSEKGLLRDL